MGTASPPIEPRTPFTPQGGAWKLWHIQAPEVVISGPAGTGKSIACMYKLHLCAENVPKLRALMLRRTRASLTESALVTFENSVLPPGHPALRGAQRSNRQAYHYPNGSTIVLGGLDKPGRVMSTEYDLIYVQEAIELTVDAWEALTTRLRNHRIPYQQLLADTNPDAPRHWLKQRCDSGRMPPMLESRHEDNPLLYDQQRGTWTEFGRQYIQKLDNLTGVRLQRLRHGLWRQSEGVVYEGWEPAIHLVDRFPIPADWPRLLAIDFGYTNPFVCQWWAVDPDGRLCLYREIYHTGRLVEDHALRIRELSRGEPAPVAVICDHDREGRATLERHLGWETTPAIKAGVKKPGIQAVAARLRRAGDGKPRLYVLRDSLDERDVALDDAKRPCCTAEEFDSYIMDPRGGEEPVKDNDHGMDALRYVVFSLDCEGHDIPTETTFARAGR